MLFSLLETPNQQHMNINTPEVPFEKSNLTIVKKEEENNLSPKVVTIKKVKKKAEILLPAPAEKYIKVKKHDFL